MQLQFGCAALTRRWYSLHSIASCRVVADRPGRSLTWARRCDRSLFFSSFASFLCFTTSFRRPSSHSSLFLFFSASSKSDYTRRKQQWVDSREWSLHVADTLSNMSKISTSPALTWTDPLPPRILSVERTMADTVTDAFTTTTCLSEKKTQEM